MSAVASDLPVRSGRWREPLAALTLLVVATVLLYRETAVMIGATHVRVGTALFGDRSAQPADSA